MYMYMCKWENEWDTLVRYCCIYLKYRENEWHGHEKTSHHTATRCSIMQHTATQCSTLHHTAEKLREILMYKCSVLQRVAACCSVLHTAHQPREDAWDTVVCIIGCTCANDTMKKLVRYCYTYKYKNEWDTLVQPYLEILLYSSNSLIKRRDTVVFYNYEWDTLVQQYLTHQSYDTETMYVCQWSTLYPIIYQWDTVVFMSEILLYIQFDVRVPMLR